MHGLCGYDRTSAKECEMHTWTDHLCVALGAESTKASVS